MLSVVLYDCWVLGRIKRKNITGGQKIKIHIDGWERGGGIGGSEFCGFVNDSEGRLILKKDFAA